MKAECLINTINRLDTSYGKFHYDIHVFSESMLYWRFQIFEMSFFKGAGIVFHHHTTFISNYLGQYRMNI
jgi:hypothetical protein